MSYEITLYIQDGSTAEQHIEALAEAEHIRREEADLIDEVMELVMSERFSTGGHHNCSMN